MRWRRLSPNYDSVNDAVIAVAVAIGPMQKIIDNRSALQHLSRLIFCRVLV